MFILNSNGDATIKRLNLDLFYKGATPLLWCEFIQISAHILENECFSAFNSP